MNGQTNLKKDQPSTISQMAVTMAKKPDFLLFWYICRASFIV